MLTLLNFSEIHKIAITKYKYKTAKTSPKFNQNYYFVETQNQTLYPLVLYCKKVFSDLRLKQFQTVSRKIKKKYYLKTEKRQHIRTLKKNCRRI